MWWWWWCCCCCCFWWFRTTTVTTRYRKDQLLPEVYGQDLAQPGALQALYHDEGPHRGGGGGGVGGGGGGGGVGGWGDAAAVAFVPERFGAADLSMHDAVRLSGGGR